MGKDSEIEWCDHTFNPWWGCSKVSPACDHCYAEKLGARFGAKWGTDTRRRTFDERHWAAPRAWNRKARKENRSARVFCASMADVFEPREDLNGHRGALWDLIEETKWLDWLLLTKRPSKIRSLIRPSWLTKPRPNVWLGTTVESQQWAKARLPELMRVPAAVRFVSCEPLLGELDLTQWLSCSRDYDDPEHKDCDVLDWVIVGGESGPGARPMHVEWARDLRDQCQASLTPFFFKQWGAHDAGLIKLGKRATGRLLDGRTCDEVPAGLAHAE